MIIKSWLILSIVSVIIQVILAHKTVRPFIGMIIPTLFLIFAGYAWYDLSNTSLPLSVFLSFLIPPILLACIFLLFYWKKRWNGLLTNHEN